MDVSALNTELICKSRVNALPTHHSGKIFFKRQMGQRISSFHWQFYLFDMFQTEAFSTYDANTYCFIDFILFRAIVTFHHSWPPQQTSLNRQLSFRASWQGRQTILLICSTSGLSSIG